MLTAAVVSLQCTSKYIHTCTCLPSCEFACLLCHRFSSIMRDKVLQNDENILLSPRFTKNPSKKTPSFPSRERNYAVRRRKCLIPNTRKLSVVPTPLFDIIERHKRRGVRSSAMLDRKNASVMATSTTCPLSAGLDTSLIPWPGMRYACVRVLELYCKVFNQIELYELIIRKTCNSCKCPREAHDVFHEEWVNVRDRLGFKAPTDPERRPSSRERSLNEGYSWVPGGLNSDKIEEYFGGLPSAKVPRLGSAGERYRDKQLMVQLPKQDLALAYCKHVDAQHHASYEDFINARNEIALDIGYVKDNHTYSADCPECRRTVGAGEVGIVAPKFGDRVLWHPACFVCSACRELLVDLTYCVHDEQLFCERHYAEQLKPRCAACDE
ncbi:hypothetical protein B566_EDAN003851, partial [Ephemera danica]